MEVAVKPSDEAIRHVNVGCFGILRQITAFPFSTIRLEC